MTAYYPVYLNLTGKRCLVFGGGPVAEDKIAKLRHSGAEVSVVSPEVTPAIRDAALNGDVEWHDRHYQPGDLEGAFLSIAATDQRKVNQQIFQEAERLGVLLNVVDDPAQCTFIAPSIVQRGSVTLAISTGGASPALARKLREALSNNSALEWADLVGVLSQARQELKKRGVKIDSQRWQCCLNQELLALVQSGREDAALDTLLTNLTDGNSEGLCSRTDQCTPEKCASFPVNSHR